MQVSSICNQEGRSTMSWMWQEIQFRGEPSEMITPSEVRSLFTGMVLGAFFAALGLVLGGHYR